MSEYNHTVVSLNQVSERIKELFRRYPEYRNLDDVEFWLTYCEHYIGFKVGSVLTHEVKNDIGKYANPQTISRMLRKLREPELREIKGQLEELVQMQGNHELYDAHVRDLKNDLHRYRYIPYNIDVLIYKHIKEEVYKELMINAEKRF